MTFATGRTDTGRSSAEKPGGSSSEELVFDRRMHDPSNHSGQFLLTQDPGLLPDGWRTWEAAGWHLATSFLPVFDLVDLHGQRVGWCLGHPIVDGVLEPPQIRLHMSDRGTLDWPAIDDLYDRMAGRFVLVLLHGEQPSVLLDAYGSLAAVYSAGSRIVASTPTLIGGDWDEDLIAEVGYPDVDYWLPFGLTLTVGVRRLQANHRLDLRTWAVDRHWPRPGTLVEDPDPHRLRAIHERLTSGIAAVAAVHPVTFSLTAGRDSRMLLACARDVVDRASFFTMAPTGVDTVDHHVAVRLAARFGLDHSVIPIRGSTPSTLARWQFRTGHAVAGELWKAHESLQALDPDRVLIQGTAGEIAGRRIPPGLDRRPGARMDPHTLLWWVWAPRRSRYFTAAEAWLDGLPDLPVHLVTELAYIEQRLSCWAGPGHYGNSTSRFEFTPFASRRLFTDMLSLPADYRHARGLVDDLCRLAWPELLEFSYNQYTGLRGARAQSVATARQAVKKGLGRLGVTRFRNSRL
jgi:hypothetical protein